MKRPEGLVKIHDMVCGCVDGNEVVYGPLKECLEYHSTLQTRSHKGPYRKINVLDVLADANGLLEHGGNICASWLTGEGKRVLEFLRKNEDPEEELEILQHIELNGGTYEEAKAVTDACHGR